MEIMRKADPTSPALSRAERAYIRQELDELLGALPTVAEGFQLKTWRTGPRTGQPKVPPAAKSLLERRLMRVDATLYPPRLFFTRKGLVALRRFMGDKRLADPQKFAHIRRELGIDAEHEHAARDSGHAGQRRIGDESHQPRRVRFG